VHKWPGSTFTHDANRLTGLATYQNRHDAGAPPSVVSTVVARSYDDDISWLNLCNGSCYRAQRTARTAIIIVRCRSRLGNKQALGACRRYGDQQTKFGSSAESVGGFTRILLDESIGGFLYPLQGARVQSRDFFRHGLLRPNDFCTCRC
jgi:hypothetical protein